jgi:hypothetical protein
MSYSISYLTAVEVLQVPTAESIRLPSPSRVFNLKFWVSRTCETRKLAMILCLLHQEMQNNPCRIKFFVGSRFSESPYVDGHKVPRRH